MHLNGNSLCQSHMLACVCCVLIVELIPKRNLLTWCLPGLTLRTCVRGSRRETPRNVRISKGHVTCMEFSSVFFNKTHTKKKKKKKRKKKKRRENLPEKCMANFHLIQSLHCKDGFLKEIQQACKQSPS